MEAQLLKQKAEGAEVQKPNLTGIPTQMKLNFERRSGLSFDDVRVHYNSDKPAQLGALAYTQGNQVHVGPGQEHHLPHELGHVIQQKAGRVRPTRWIGGLPINDQPELEREAGLAPVQCMPSPARQDVIQKQPDPEEEQEEEEEQAEEAENREQAEEREEENADVSADEFLPFGENSAWYGSVHDNLVGSIYFEHGRLRLIHDFGPQVERVKDEAQDADIVRYLILSNDDTQANSIANQLQALYSEPDAESTAGSILEIDGCRIYQLSDNTSISQLNLTPDTIANARLFEIYLSGGQCYASHLSRGGIAQLPSKWTDPAQGSATNLSTLTYAVTIAEQVSRQMAQCYIRVMAYTANDPAVIDYFSQNGISIANDIFCAYPPGRQQGDVFAAIQRQINEIMSPQGIGAALGKALSEEFGDQPLRFGGFLGNKILRASGQLSRENLGFDVDPEGSD